ncbi:CAP domain-containing protein [Natronosporangium hydrolyticum]|uniref:CAP domain-containing protein n=1 Tax=Natronosporangium hydrolyticum TaxID=2811111 RepID=A0A895YTQ2_9ACTN|nr:CAP domain-containing protein [Natronosporangium hydrolyticum]
MEDEVTRLTNEQRRNAGCGDVGTDERLRTAARNHSQDMATHDYFSHTGRDGSSPSDRMRAAGYPNPAGENIAYGYRSPADVMDGWMNSDGHRRNLLNCAHQTIGVGLAFDGNGRPYWTQVFGR